MQATPSIRQCTQNLGKRIVGHKRSHMTSLTLAIKPFGSGRPLVVFSLLIKHKIMFFKDPLAVATANLLDTVKEVAAAVAQKKKVIEDARVAIEEANQAIDAAQTALNER